MKRSLIIPLLTAFLSPNAARALTCADLTHPRFDVTRFTVDGHELQQQLLNLDAAAVGTVTSSRQERRKVVEAATLDTFERALSSRLGPAKIVARDAEPVETSTDYRLKFRGVNGRGEWVFKMDLRWRVYLELGTGRPRWEILSDDEGEYGKLEIKRPGFFPGVFAQRFDDIRKTSAVMHKADYRTLLNCTPEKFREVRGEIASRMLKIRKNGKLMNRESEVQALIDMVGWMIEQGLSLRDPVVNVRYKRTALKLFFTYSKSRLDKLLRVKELSGQAVRIWAAAPGEKRAPEAAELLKEIRNEKARLRAELRSAKGNALGGPPSDTEVFDVDLTADRDVTITDLETGAQAISPGHHRTLEFKTSILAIADLTDEELELIGANDYLFARSSFLAMNLAPNTPTDTGKRSVAQQAARVQVLEDDDF